MSQAIGYVRVSTADQDLGGQRLRLETAGVARTFEDVATGRTFNRPGLNAALDYAREGDTLCVVRLDRLGRSMRELLDLVEELKRRGIALRSLEEQIDTSSATGGLTFHLFAAMAEFERRLISERVRDGVASARARGKVPGRPKLNGKSAAARLLIGEGMSPTEAAATVGIDRATVYRFLRLNPIERPLPEVEEPEADPGEEEGGEAEAQASLNL